MSHQGFSRHSAERRQSDPASYLMLLAALMLVCVGLPHVVLMRQEIRSV